MHGFILLATLLACEKTTLGSIQLCKTRKLITLLTSSTIKRWKHTPIIAKIILKSIIWSSNVNLIVCNNLDLNRPI